MARIVLVHGAFNELSGARTQLEVPVVAGVRATASGTTV